MSRKSCRSAGRRLAVMKWRNGSIASRSPSISPTRPSVSGSSPVVQASFSTGCMTKKVRNSARPISTMLGGVPCVRQRAAQQRQHDDDAGEGGDHHQQARRQRQHGDQRGDLHQPAGGAGLPAAPRSMFTRLRVRDAGSSRQQATASTQATDHGVGSGRVEPADHNVLCAAGQQQHTPLVAPHQVQPAARIEREHVLHREQSRPLAGRAREAAEPRRAAGKPDQRQHRGERGDGGEERAGPMTMARPFAGGGRAISRMARRCAASARDSVVDRSRQDDEVADAAAAFVGLQVERLGAEQADLLVEPGEIDRTPASARARATSTVSVSSSGQCRDGGRSGRAEQVPVIASD